MSFIKNILNSRAGSQIKGEPRRDELFETKINQEVMFNEEIIAVWLILIGSVFFSM